jgi:hypothetical protein
MIRIIRKDVWILDETDLYGFTYLLKVTRILLDT